MGSNTVQQRIRMARAMKIPQLSQQDFLARLQLEGLNISQSTLSKIENNSRYVTDIELKTIATVLEVSVAWLIGESDKF